MGFPPQGTDKGDLALAAALAVVDGNVDTLLTNVATVDTVVDAIRATTDALEVLTETGGTLTTDGNEQNIYINNAPDGVYVPEYVSIDFTNHTATETVIIRQYRRFKSGGDWIKIDECEAITGLPDPAGIDVELKPNRYGIKVTMEKTAGTNRAYDWEVFYKT